LTIKSVAETATRIKRVLVEYESSKRKKVNMFCKTVGRPCPVISKVTRLTAKPAIEIAKISKIPLKN
jgi:hypothetical protein